MATATARIDIRCSKEQRALIDRAVELSGRKMTDFVLDAVQRAAVETIKNFEVMHLTTRDSAVLAEALLRPPQPNSRLRRAAERYQA